MRIALKTLFLGILVFMLWITIKATLNRGMLDEGAEIWPYWWFRATLADAYCGFLTFFAWVAYKERPAWRKVLWFVLIVTLGNIAMSIYMLIELFRLKHEEPLTTLLIRRNG